MSKRDIADILLKVKAVTLSPSEPYTYASGIKSPIYTDNRLLMSHTPERRQIIEALRDSLKEHGIVFDVIAGTATAGIPWAAWLSDMENAPMIYVRSSKKGHGKGNRIEGVLEKGQRVVVIEDLISTGGSSIDTVEAIREAGGEVDTIIAIFTYGMPQVKKNFSDAGCQLVPLCDFSSLIDEAVERKYITEEEAEVTREWNSDTGAWGKKHGFE